MRFEDWTRRYFKPDPHCQDPELEEDRAKREFQAYQESLIEPESTEKTDEEKRVAAQLEEMTNRRSK